MSQNLYTSKFLFIIKNINIFFPSLKMERTESTRKIEIREQITELLDDFEENLKNELKETAFQIIEDVENNYKDITINPQALPHLLDQMRVLLHDFQKHLVVHTGGSQGRRHSQSKLKFKDFIETQHITIEWAIISIEKLGIFVTGDPKGHIHIWDSHTLQVIKRHSLSFPIKTFAFDPKTDRLIVASDSSQAQKPLQSFKISKEGGLDIHSALVFDSREPVLTLHVIEEERKLLVEDHHWCIQVWNLDDNKHILDLKIEGDQWVTRGDGIAYLPENKLIVVPGADKQIAPVIRKKIQDAGKSSLRLFSIESGELVKEKVLNFMTVDRMLVTDDRLVVIDNHGSLLFLNKTTLEEEKRIDFEDNQILDAVYSKKLDLLVCTTESAVVILVKYSEARVLRKLHPRVTNCDRSLIYLEGEDKVLLPFQVDESDLASIGVLDLGKDYDLEK